MSLYRSAMGETFRVLEIENPTEEQRRLAYTSARRGARDVGWALMPFLKEIFPGDGIEEDPEVRKIRAFLTDICPEPGVTPVGDEDLGFLSQAEEEDPEDPID